MSPKLKKAIIAVVVFLLVGVIALVAVSMLSNLSTTTVYDLRLVDATTEEELFEKDVYLTAVSKNNFNVKIESSTSSLLEYVVVSSNTNVATVTKDGGEYKINYLSVGKAVISVMPAEDAVVKDSFVLNVKENIPNSFNFVDAEGNALANNEVTIYADDRDYRFDFVATKGTIKDNINLSQVVVVKNYNESVFEEIYVDDATSQLVINAKQNEGSTREYITLQAKHKDSMGSVTTETFNVCVNVLGNYISDIQLMLNEEPNFDASSNIYGSGTIKEGEQRIQNVYLSAGVNAVYAKIRVVYTNGEYKDVTDGSGSQSSFGTATELIRLGNYYKIIVPTGVESVTIKFWYGSKEEDLTFYYLGEKTSAAYINKVNSFYERYTEENGAKVYYRYTYWDQRFMRNDAIVDKEGRIVGFAGGNPTNVVDD